MLWYAKPQHEVTVICTCKMECHFIKPQTKEKKATVKFPLSIWPASSITVTFSWLLPWIPLFPWQQSFAPHSQFPNLTPCYVFHVTSSTPSLWVVLFHSIVYWHSFSEKQGEDIKSVAGVQAGVTPSLLPCCHFHGAVFAATPSNVFFDDGTSSSSDSGCSWLILPSAHHSSWTTAVVQLHLCLCSHNSQTILAIQR